MKLPTRDFSGSQGMQNCDEKFLHKSMKSLKVSPRIERHFFSPLNSTLCLFSSSTFNLCIARYPLRARASEKRENACIRNVAFDNNNSPLKFRLSYPAQENDSRCCFFVYDVYFLVWDVELQRIDSRTAEA